MTIKKLFFFSLSSLVLFPPALTKGGPKMPPLASRSSMKLRLAMAAVPDAQITTTSSQITVSSEYPTITLQPMHLGEGRRSSWH